MLVRYNGVELQVERVVSWSDKNIYSEDNSERMMRHVSMMVQCVIHPQATTIPERDVSSAPAIVSDLKRRLLEPRRFLMVKVGDIEVLSSPAVTERPDLPGSQAFDGSRIHFCDARGGPHPLYVDVVSIHGTRTMLATFAIETWLVDSSALELIPREGQPNKAEFSALISHRWEQSNDLDENYFSTRITTGRAVFRADYLYEFDDVTGGLRQIERKPADYVASLNHPLPLNYRRESVRTSVSSDGLSLTYTIVDREQASTIGPQKMVSSITGTWSGGVSQLPDMTTGITYFPRYFTQINITAVGRRGATTSDVVHACLRAAATFDRGVQLSRRMYYDNKITVSVGNGPRTANLSIGSTIGGAAPAIVDAGFAIVKNAIIRQIDFIDKQWIETLRDGLGQPISEQAEGQQPLLGMIGGNLNLGLSGGQQRINSQQILDGQTVPPMTPESTEARLSQDADADNARTARGDVRNRE